MSEYLTPLEAARLLGRGWTASDIRKRIDLGIMPGVKLGRGWVVERAEVDRLLAQREAADHSRRTPARRGQETERAGFRLTPGARAALRTLQRQQGRGASEVLEGLILDAIGKAEVG